MSNINGSNIIFPTLLGTTSLSGVNHTSNYITGLHKRGQPIALCLKFLNPPSLLSLYPILYSYLHSSVHPLFPHPLLFNVRKTSPSCHYWYRLRAVSEGGNTPETKLPQWFPICAGSRGPPSTTTTSDHPHPFASTSIHSSIKIIKQNYCDLRDIKREGCTWTLMLENVLLKKSAPWLQGHDIWWSQRYSRRELLFIILSGVAEDDFRKTKGRCFSRTTEI